MPDFTRNSDTESANVVIVNAANEVEVSVAR